MEVRILAEIGPLRIDEDREQAKLNLHSTAEIVLYAVRKRLIM